MWLIHEHSQYTSAIDKYWVFTKINKALSHWKSMVSGYKDSIDDRTFEQLMQKNTGKEFENITIGLGDGVYLVFSEIDNDGFARRL